MESELRIIPESSGTVLWFEYLLNPSLLEKQLLRENSGILKIQLRNLPCV